MKGLFEEYTIATFLSIFCQSIPRIFKDFDEPNNKRGMVWSEEEAGIEENSAIQTIMGRNGEAAVTEGPEKTGGDIGHSSVDFFTPADRRRELIL